MLGAFTIAIAIGLTAILFATRQAFLGFAAAGGWALFGGYCYTQSTTAWDIYGLMGFFSLLGMTFVCMFGAYAMREEKKSMVDRADEIEEPKELGEIEPTRLERIQRKAKNRRIRNGLPK